jgi:hypothetical protein
MEPVTLIIATLALIFIIVALIPRNATPPRIDPDALTYCRTCGCNHRQQWMTWDDGTYRCTVCCTH